MGRYSNVTGLPKRSEAKKRRSGPGPAGPSSNFFTGAVGTDIHDSAFTNINIGGDQINVNQRSDTKEILADLKPVERGGYYVPPCMEGTRKAIFDDIDQWLDNLDAPNNILLLSGNPGAGKSTVASSLVSRLTERRRLGSYFFFKRGDVTLSNPAAVWRTVAHDLARYDATFSDNLFEVLKEKTVDPGRPDIALHFKFLIQEPLARSHNHFASHTVPVIVIDALDECDYDGSQAAQRRAFLDTLLQWSSLSKMFKLVVTSRNERMLDRLRAICQQMALPTGEAVSTDTNKDILQFFQDRFAELRGSSLPEWPGNRVLNALTAKAAGLFIWAETVMKFLEQGLPDEQLELVLAGDLGEGDNITKLYQQILEFAFPAPKASTLELFKLVVSTIVLAKVPLRTNDLHEFVSQPKPSVAFILHQLSSVIFIEGTDQILHIGHLSFSEFLCDHQ